MIRSAVPLAALALLSSLTLTACLDEDEKGPESDLLEDAGKADSHQRPTDHGAIAFDTSVLEALTDAAGFHAWEFVLTGDASIDASTTYAVLGQRKVDTVLYLYKEGPSGWGSYIARNDDDGNRVYSRIVRPLGAGRYRVLVKGYATSTRGRFAIKVGCQGAGCAPVVVTDVCNFDGSYPDVRANPAFVRANDRYITAPSQLDARETAQALASIRSVYGAAEIPDLAAGLARVDDDSLRFTNLFYAPMNTDLTAVEFGAGDTSVGLIFYGTGLQVAASISDGEIDDCAFFAPRAPASVGAGGSCRATSECTTGLSCNGIVANAGVCVTIANPPGEGAECRTDAACGSAALVCAGATRGYGMCRPSWMRGTFADAATSAVPDAGTLARTVVARGLATVDTDVVLSLTVDHPRASQLRITLTNPAGSEVLVHQGVAADNGRPLVIARPIEGFSGDESVNGEWTLRITDATTGQTGTVRGWSLTLTSRWD